MWNPLDGLAEVNVSFVKFDILAITPTYGSAEAAGADLYSMDDVILHPGSREIYKIHTGIGIQLPKGFEAQVRPRSGFAAKYGITVVNSPGTIDSDYRGEISVLLMNHGNEKVAVNFGDRIAQLVIVPIFRANFIRVTQLGESDRGTGGFGSTGV